MLIYVPLSQIDDNPFQARVEYGDVAELAADIIRQAAARPDTRGLQQVPSARLVGDDGDLVPAANLEPDEFLDGETLHPVWRVQLEFGHRRRRAFEYLARNGAPEYGLMPLNLRDLTDEQMLDGVWQENRSRRDLSSVEEAELLARKLAQLGNQRAVAEAWGIARPTVANKLQLLQLPADIQQANRDGRLSERACLALAPVVTIQALTNGRTKWGKADQYWGPPVAPADFIQQVVSGEKISSDDIRDYTKNALRHVGRDLPKAVADMRAPQGGAIVSSGCAGCASRINNTCLTPECLEAKTEVLKEQTIADAETVLGIPFSDREEDFVFANWEDKKVLQQIWDSGGQRGGSNFVFAWRTNEAALRPFVNNRLEFVHMNTALAEDPRAAIAIGHRGNFPLHLLPDGGERSYMPESAMRQAWDKEAKRLMKEAHQKAVDALWDMIDRRLDDGLMDMMQALIARPESEWQYEREEQVRLVLTHLLQYGGGTVTHIHSMRDMQRLTTMLNRAGLDADAVLSTGTKSTNLRRQGILGLHYYWCTNNYERSYSYDQVRPVLVAAINAFDLAAPFGAADEEYATLHTELRHALHDLDKRAEAEEAM